MRDDGGRAATTSNQAQWMTNKFRLLTRGDFDGVVCAALLTEQNLIDEMVFVDPRQMQYQEVVVTARDITANLPYVPGCHIAFDHHASETQRSSDAPADRFINDPDSPSAARVIYRHYGGAKTFTRIPRVLMEAVDRADAARFTQEEVMNPIGYVLLNFLLDPRTGLGRFRDFRVSTPDLLRQMVDECLRKDEQQLLLLPDVSERVRLYFEHELQFKQQLRRCSELLGNLVLVDLRDEEMIYAGNRFMVYALFPEATVSMTCLRVEDGRTTFAIGRSILNRTTNLDVGALCLEFGGGGHAAAGTCQVPNDDAEDIKIELIKRILIAA